ncbi:hypothetical protein SDC9_16381 [bioreactor metagenome]|uniref:Uncharacterized protein n=1 Tax=bioreactor metagenome TaxID=1076179 RepID=A0A644TWP8_9ZZZZ
MPGKPPGVLRYREQDAVGGGVEHEVEVVVVLFSRLLGRTVDHGGQGMVEGAPVGRQAPLVVPGDVGKLVAVPVLAGEELGSPEGGMGLSESDQAREEAQQLPAPRGVVPVVPADFIVLAVGVVVAALAPPYLVSPQHHGGADGQKKGGHEVAQLPGTLSPDMRILGGTFDPEVLGPVFLRSVPVVLAVFLVMLAQVADQVVEGEAVVGRDKVDGVEGFPAVPQKEVAGAGNAGGQMEGAGFFAPPEAADIVPVFVVPFRPSASGKRTHLVGPAGVPGFGDDLRVPQERLFGDGLDDRRVFQQLPGGIPAQDRAEIEAEAIDVHLDHPVAQAVLNEAAHDRVVAVEGVAAAGIVFVPALIRVEHIINRIVQAPERECGTEFVALGGMIEDHVENYLDARLVELPYHVLEFPDREGRIALIVGFAVPVGVAGLGSEKGEGGITPVVAQKSAGLWISAETLDRIEFVQGKKFEARNAQLLEVPDHFRHAAIGPRMLHGIDAGRKDGTGFGASAGRQGPRAGIFLPGGTQEPPGESPHVGLVDDAVFQRIVEGGVVLPIEIVVHDDAFGQKGVVPVGGKGEIRLGRCRVVAQGPAQVPGAVGKRPGVGVYQASVYVEALSGGGLVGTVGPPQIEGSGLQAANMTVPHVPRFVGKGVESELAGRGAFVDSIVETEGHSPGVSGENGKTHSLRAGECADAKRIAWFQTGLGGYSYVAHDILSHGFKNYHSVLSAETHGIFYEGPDRHAHALVGNIVEVAGGIGIFVIDGGVNVAFPHSQNARDGLDGACGADAMPRHGLETGYLEPFGMVAEGGFYGFGFDRIVQGRRGAVGAHPVYVVGVQSGVGQGKPDSPGDTDPFGIGGGEMVGVAGLAEARDLRVNLRSSGKGMLVFFQHEDSGSLGHHKAVPVPVERSGSLFGLLVPGGQGLNVDKAGHAHAHDAGFGAAGDDRVGLVVPDESHGLSYGVGSRGAGGDDALAGAGYIEGHGDLGRTEVGQGLRHGEGRHPGGAPFDQAGDRLLDTARSALPRSDADPRPFGFHSFPGQAGVGQGFGGGEDRKLGITVHFFGFFRIDAQGGVEAFDLPGDTHGHVGSVHQADRPDSGTTRLDRFPEAGNIIADGTYHAKSGDDDFSSFHNYIPIPPSTWSTTPVR